MYPDELIARKSDACRFPAKAGVAMATSPIQFGRKMPTFMGV